MNGPRLYGILPLVSRSIYLRNPCFRLLAVFILLIISFFTANIAMGTQSSYSVEEIADALLAAEAQFENLRFDYIEDFPASGNGYKPGQRVIARGVFARNLPKGWLYLDCNVSLLEISTGQLKVQSDDLTIFNGETTLILDRNTDRDPKDPNSKGRSRAIIVPGRAERLLDVTADAPHYKIWCFGKTSFGEILKKEDSNIKIINQAEYINGFRAIKLEGTLSQGRATMTLCVCPDLNFLPLKVCLIRHEDNALLTNRLTSDFIKLPNGMFYPQKVTLGDANSPSGYITISNISIDPIPEEFFRPVLPPNTHVTDHVIKLSYTTGDAVDFGLANAKERARTEDETVRPEPPIAHPPNGKNTHLITIALSIIILATLALIIGKLFFTNRPITKER